MSAASVIDNERSLGREVLQFISVTALGDVDKDGRVDIAVALLSNHTAAANLTEPRFISSIYIIYLGKLFHLSLVTSSFSIAHVECRLAIDGSIKAFTHFSSTDVPFNINDPQAAHFGRALSTLPKSTKGDMPDLVIGMSHPIFCLSAHLAHLDGC